MKRGSAILLLLLLAAPGPATAAWLQTCCSPATAAFYGPAPAQIADCASAACCLNASDAISRATALTVSVQTFQAAVGCTAATPSRRWGTVAQAPAMAPHGLPTVASEHLLLVLRC
ncbi:MAG: hypothetical protein ACE5HV_13365 [Acidobacteriota bacterium]